MHIGLPKRKAARPGSQQTVSGRFLGRQARALGNPHRANAVSLAGATISLARRVYSDLSARTTLMIGAGEMNELTARHFVSAGVKRLVIANRTVSRAQTLATELKGHAAGLDDLDKELADADIVIACTASPVPVITKRAAEAPFVPTTPADIHGRHGGAAQHRARVADLEDVIFFRSTICSNWWTRTGSNANSPRVEHGC